MENEIKKDVISVLKDVINILKKEKENIFLIKEMSNHVIHDSTIFQDNDTISIAIIIYALSKIMERGIESKLKGSIISELEKAKEALEKDDVERYRDRIDNIVKKIKEVDKKLKLYVENVLGQAAVRKGTKIYAHGVSLTRVAKILDISQWELMRYVGNTKISEEYDSLYNVRQRVEFAKSLFGVK